MLSPPLKFGIWGFVVRPKARTTVLFRLNLAFWRIVVGFFAGVGFGLLGKMIWGECRSASIAAKVLHR